MPSRRPFDCALRPATARPSESASSRGCPSRSATTVAQSVSTGARLTCTVVVIVPPALRVQLRRVSRQRRPVARHQLPAPFPSYPHVGHEERAVPLAAFGGGALVHLPVRHDHLAGGID